VTVILVAGIVHHLDRLVSLGEIRRTRWNAAALDAPAIPADLVVLGDAGTSGEALAAIRALKGPRGAPGIPVLHVQQEPGCACAADLCLAGVGPRGLLDAARVLLRASRCPPRRPTLADGAASVPAELGASLAHDLANLLGIVVGQCQLGARVLQTEPAARLRFERIAQAAERAADLLRRVASHSRRHTEAVPVDVNEVVTELSELLDRVLGDDVSIELRPGALPARVLGDRDELEHALLNLALNARDAMPRGGRLTIETRNVDLQESGGSPPLPAGRFVLLSVSDEGKGMDEQTRARAFEPFFTTRADPAGHGLGLSSVRRAVQRAGGAVALDSTPGLGTTFRIWLPLAAPGGSAPEAAAAGACDPSAQP
jgi:signal transduction histidine kinase